MRSLKRQSERQEAHAAGASVELVVGITGPSGAGKSAVARAVGAHLGDSAAILSYDAYYRDLSGLPQVERDRTDFDVPDALEAELLITHLQRLRRGERVALPSYDFIRHLRTEQRRAIAPCRVVLVDGLFVLVEERIRVELDLAVYVDAPEHLRLQRRIARDVEERGWTEAQIRSHWNQQVRRAEIALIEPSRRWADIVLTNDGSLSHSAEQLAHAILGRLATA